MVELIGWLWRNAPRLSLAHDVSDGGLAHALAEASEPSAVASSASDAEAAVRLGRAGRRAEKPPDWSNLRELGAGRLMCGVFGIRAPERDVARVTYFGLFALQHRGQESAGIAVSDQGRLTVLRDMGLVTQVFDEQKLRGLHGDVAIGHTRYSTTGSTQWANAQPLIQRGRGRTVALGHNGNLVNAAALRDELAAEGITLATTSDTEIIAALIANDPAPLEDAVANAMARLEGAFSVVMLSEGKLIGFRDQHGFRPLVPRPRRGRRVDPRLGDVRARPRRRRAGARARAGRARLDRRDGREPAPGRRAGRPQRALHLRVLLPRPPRHAPGRGRGARRAAADGRAARAGGACRGRPRATDPGLRHAGGDRLLARDGHPVLARA